MKPKLTVITLGVDDLDRSLAFYRDGLGFLTEGIIGTEFEHGAVVFRQLNGGVTLALWPRTSLSAEANVPVVPPSPSELTLGHNVASREQVDEVMAEAAGAGAAITDPAHDRAWGGYSGHFQDPDGHVWETAWNPAWPIED